MSNNKSESWQHIFNEIKEKEEAYERKSKGKNSLQLYLR